jgi:hypothetical protein
MQQVSGVHDGNQTEKGNLNMRRTQRNIAKLTHHLDELTAAVRRFRRECKPMIDPDCAADLPCEFCMELQGAMTAGDEMLDMLREALRNEREHDTTEAQG